MKVLVFTGLFPNNVWPNHGIFILQRMAHVARSPNCEIRIVAPVPYYPPWLVGWRAAYRKIVRNQKLEGLQVDYPRYFMIPKIGMVLQGVLLFLSVIPHIARLKKEFGFQVIDAHYVYPDGLAAVLLGWMFKVPVVVSARGSDLNVFKDFPIIRRIIQWTLQRANAVITVSQALKDEAVNLGVPPEKVRVIPNGVDPIKFYPLAKDEARKELGLPLDGRKIIVSVGNLTSNKGFDLLIKSLKEISEKSKEINVLLLIIGGGAQKRALEDLIQKFDLHSVVQLSGSVPHERLVWYYNAADLVCLMSEREGWPNVVLEALACGRPVLAPPVGGIPEIVATPQVGSLVERDVVKIAQGLEQALQRSWSPQEITEYSKTFTWTRSAESVRHVLMAVLSSHNTASSSPVSI